MLNGIKYFPFKLKGDAPIDQGPYQYIKFGYCNSVWKIHEKCNMIVNNNNKYDVNLLCDLFEQMFEYNPCDRITTDGILKHKWIVNNENRKSFHLTNLELEICVRELYNATKHIYDTNIIRVSGPSTFHSLTSSIYNPHKTHQQDSIALSSSNINLSKAVSACSTLMNLYS